MKWFSSVLPSTKVTEGQLLIQAELKEPDPIILILYLLYFREKLLLLLL